MAPCIIGYDNVLIKIISGFCVDSVNTDLCLNGHA
jgi:hypothetical protein